MSKHTNVAEGRNSYFWSDPHFYHGNIIKYSGRPFDSVATMNRALIENHNAIVGPDDDSYCLGDFAFAQIDKIKDILSQLNGNKFITVGNHDSEIVKYRRHLIDGHYFKDIHERIEIKVNGQFIVLNHYGMRVWNKSHHGSWLLYGHSHSTLPPYGRSVDVGVDSTWVTGQAEYRPFSFHDIKAFMDKQTVVNADYHGRKDEK